jgi:hypothetical protein
MGLATVIRLEFAYPGVGVLAGDSLQYLSTATAHGVIMVFFMIMPLLFGAFGNFLLPTQLGVHDVAFPRLNSAAFWFLPGGLIMLCQLVCVDRRYQRMNCFNIRELQGILKRRFFTDLVNTSDFRNTLESSIIGLRFKTNNSLPTTPNSFAFYNFGTTSGSKGRTYLLTSTNSPSVLHPALSLQSANYSLINYFSPAEFFFFRDSATFFLSTLSNYIYGLLAQVSLPQPRFDDVSGFINLLFNYSNSLIVEVCRTFTNLYTASMVSVWFITAEFRSF